MTDFNDIMEVAEMLQATGECSDDKDFFSTPEKINYYNREMGIKVKKNKKKKVYFTCKNCGVIKEISNLYRPQKFCSNACANASRKGTKYKQK